MPEKPDSLPVKAPSSAPANPTQSDQELQAPENIKFIRAGRDVAAAVTITIVRFFTAIVERFGWPGAAIFLVFFCIQRWASDEQKREIIDKYILGKGMQEWWPFVIVSLFFLLLVWGQHVIYKRELGIKDAELKRVGKEKSGLQETSAGREWKHVEEIEGDS